MSRTRDRVFKTILVLGVCLLIAQVFIASNYDVKLMQLGNISNSTRLILRQMSVVHNSTYRIPDGATLTSTKNLSTAPPEGRHEGHSGFALAKRVLETCKSVKERSIGKFYSIQGSVSKRLLYCPMEKIGTTFWRRVMYMLTSKDSSRYQTPYDVPILTALKADRQYYVPIKNAAAEFVKSSSFTFMFVRNPYSRLLSAFIDKLVPPNPYYWKVFGSKAITDFRKAPNSRSKEFGHDVTFSEFVKHVISSERTKRFVDPHFISTFSSCKPCDTRYKYIGKMENFKEDALYILNKVGMNSSVKVLSKSDKFKELTIDDAITDSIYSPFGWQKGVLKIISWDQALRRVWLKLQMRGIISFTESFDLHMSITDIANLTADQFISKARHAHLISEPANLKQQKVDVMKEAFMTLHIDDLKAFRNTFKNDFVLFGYDDSPALLFNRSSQPQAALKYFNYNHLN